MATTTAIKLNNSNSTRLAPGVYVAFCDVEVSLNHGVGDSLRSVEFRLVKAGAEFTVTPGANQFWTGGSLTTCAHAHGEESQLAVRRIG